MLLVEVRTLDKKEEEKTTPSQTEEEKTTQKIPNKTTPVETPKDTTSDKASPQGKKPDISEKKATETPQLKSRKPSIEYDKYDKQVLTLKNLGYSEQQIIDNLLRLNPELHENKHIAAQSVGKYFERKEFIPESAAPVMMGGIELTEELKEFIESVLRKQLDAFRNIIKEERDRRLSFTEALSIKTLEWGPILLLITLIFSLSFLFYKGGLACLGCIFYGPPVMSQIIPFSLVFLLFIIILAITFLKEYIYDEKVLDKFKVLIYLILFPFILSIQIMAYERYTNEKNWQDFTGINNKEYFLKKWYETDYRERVVFIDRLGGFIKDINYNELIKITKPLIYLEIDLFEDAKYLPDLKQIALYEGILLYDSYSSNKDTALEKLKELLAKENSIIEGMKTRLSILKNSDKKNGLQSKCRFHSPECVLNIMKMKEKEKEIIINRITGKFSQ